MSTLLIAKKADGSPWNPTRNARINAWALMKRLHPNTGVFERVVDTIGKPEELLAWLWGHRDELGAVNRFDEEGYILAFDAKLKREGKPALSARQHVGFRRAGAQYDKCFGLGIGTVLFDVWEQCIAKWHAYDAYRIPPSVKRIITGARHLEAIQEDVAILLEDDTYLRRHRRGPPLAVRGIRETVIREWVQASGGIQRHLDVVTRMLGQDKDHRLRHLAESGGYETLAPEMVDIARQLAGGDARLAFFTFRTMQRIAACTVEGEAMWIAEWLRGTGRNPNAIPGTTGKPELVEIVHDHLLGDVTKGHSGAAAIPTTYRVRLQLSLGPCGHEEAAQRLGISLTARGLPRR